MFENMTDREKKLLYATFFLVPIGVLFTGVFWFISAYNAKSDQVSSLSITRDAEALREAEGKKALRRQNYYNSISLPSDLVSATNEYQSWLKLMMDELEFESPTFKPLDAGTIQARMNSEVIGRRKSFTVQTRGSLAQLNKFLSEFYSVDLLHRINSLKIIPVTEGSGKKERRTGKLSIIMTVEAVSLAKAEDRENFTDSKRALVRNIEDYQLILRRNIFGPANNAPKLSVRPVSVTTGNDASVRVSAEDADQNDLLTFELVKSSIEGVKLEPSTDPTSKRTRFVVPSQEPGTFEFVVKVTDNGYPPKESEETLTVKFNPPRKPPVVVEKKEPVPVPYKNIKQTQVTGIVKNKNGDWEVWVWVRTTDQRYQLVTGDTFELDEQEFTISDVQKKFATFKAGDKVYVGRLNAIERGFLIEQPGEEKAKVSSTTPEL